MGDVFCSITPQHNKSGCDAKPCKPKQHANRPQLLAALQECRKKKATLVIAKLDRLGRNVAFISALMESGVDFVCCDNPHANRLMLHMLAAFAEHEREQISQRTIAA